MTRVEMVRISADQPGHDIQRGDLFGVVAAVQHDLERRLRRLRPAGRPAGRGSAPWRSTPPRAAVALPIAVGSDGVGVHQDLRLFAAVDPAREVGRDVQHEQHVAARQRLVGLGSRRAYGRMSK